MGFKNYLNKKTNYTISNKNSIEVTYEPIKIVENNTELQQMQKTIKKLQEEVAQLKAVKNNVIEPKNTINKQPIENIKPSNNITEDIMKRAAMIYEGLPEPIVKKFENTPTTPTEIKEKNISNKFGDAVGRAAMIL